MQKSGVRKLPYDLLMRLRHATQNLLRELFCRFFWNSQLLEHRGQTFDDIHGRFDIHKKRSELNKSKNQEVKKCLSLQISYIITYFMGNIFIFTGILLAQKKFNITPLLKLTSLLPPKLLELISLVAGVTNVNV